MPDLFAMASFWQFNCFLLMPVVDKLPALLQEDLDSAFEDVDNVFDISTMRHSLGQRKRETEIELKRVSCCHLFSWLAVDIWCLFVISPLNGFLMQIQRLKEKFREIHEHLSSSQAMLRP